MQRIVRLTVFGAVIASVAKTTVPEGTTKRLPNGKPLLCSGPEWTVGMLTRTAHIDAITVKGAEVSVDNASFKDAGDISMSESTAIMRELAGVESDPVDRAVVAVDDGKAPVHVLARKRGFWGRVWRWIVTHVRCTFGSTRSCSVRYQW